MLSKPGSCSLVMEDDAGSRWEMRSLSSVDDVILDKQNKASAMEDTNNGYITKIGTDGNIEKVKVETSVSDSTVGILSPNFFGRPLESMIDTTRKWNPFHKKCAILGVMKAISKRNRVVSKHGHVNTYRKEEDTEQNHRYLKDCFISMIDMPWHWTILSFGASFYISWLVFAVLWYIVALEHGDLEEDRDPDKVCVDKLHDFTSCFLFSLETQHTIGYGGRATTENCVPAILLMSVQSIVGVIIQACMAGILFAKFTKPTMRAETFIFSKNALISVRNGSLYLMVRIGDLRQTHLLESHISGHIVKKRTTLEGEVIPYMIEKMEFGSHLDGSEEYLQLLWPMVVSHKIDSSSPLYNLNPRDILDSQFEIILTLEGVTPETGNTIQVRSSYLPNEILWGYRFEQTCVAYDKKVAKYAVSFKTINSIRPDRTPRCSAEELENNNSVKEED